MEAMDLSTICLLLPLSARGWLVHVTKWYVMYQESYFRTFVKDTPKEEGLCFLLFNRFSSLCFLYFAESFQIDVVPLVYFSFCHFCFWCQVQKLITKIDVKELTAWCKWSNFILLYVTTQLFQPFIEETALSPLYIPDSFIIN